MTVKKNTIINAVLFAVFVIYTICVRNVDAMPIGPEGSIVGFSSVNKPVADALGYNEFFYDVSKVLGLFSFVVVGAIALYALLQVIKRKGIFKADQDCYVMGIFYVLVGLFYLFFEIVIINYRPVILDEGLEASFPSSHTMLAVSVFITAAMWLKNRVAPKYVTYVNVMLYTFALLVVVSRALSGVHWLTDIIGGILAGAFLISVYMTLVSVMQTRETTRKD